MLGLGGLHAPLTFLSQWTDILRFPFYCCSWKCLLLHALCGWAGPSSSTWSTKYLPSKCWQRGGLMTEQRPHKSQEI